MRWYVLASDAADAFDDWRLYMELARDRHAEKENHRKESALRERKRLLRRTWAARRAVLQQEQRSAGLRWRIMPGAARHKAEAFDRRRKQAVSKHKKQVQQAIRCRTTRTA